MHCMQILQIPSHCQKMAEQKDSTETASIISFAGQDSMSAFASSLTGRMGMISIKAEMVLTWQGKKSMNLAQISPRTYNQALYIHPAIAQRPRFLHWFLKPPLDFHPSIFSRLTSYSTCPVVFRGSCAPARESSLQSGRVRFRGCQSPWDPRLLLVAGRSTVGHLAWARST